MFLTLILLKASMNLGYPILCHPSQKRCYWAQDGQEVNSGLGIDLRVLGSAAINLNNDLLYITGGFGFTGALNSTEIHAFQEKPKIGPELPFPTSDHCLVQIGLDEFMLIGFDKSANENRYFIYDLSTEKWNEELEDGPRSGSLYSQQYCKAFKVGEKVKVFRSGYAYKSYIFDVSSKKWENGPDLPEKKVSYEIVINPTGDGILMIGGYAGGNYSRNIWEMKCDQTENCDWNMAPYKFQFGRASHTAFYVPENLANCYYPDPNVP